MFSSPAMRLQNHENPEAVMARKPGQSNTLQRKVFQDRDVNNRRQEGRGSFKPKLNLFNDTKLNELKKPELKYPDWLMDTVSYKEVEDTYSDIMSERILHTNKKKLSAPKQKPVLFVENNLDNMVLQLPVANTNFGMIDYQNMNLDDFQF